MDNNDEALDTFLAAEEHAAFRMAQISTGSRDDALDIVQDAMMGFVEKYRSKPDEQWRPLFYRVLNSRITDWYRRKKVRSIIGFFSSESDGPDSATSPMPGPAQDLKSSTAMQALEAALRALPLRQQQAVLLRVRDGFNVEETATAMGVSSGSVKTHYHRGIKALRRQLGEHWP